MYFCTNSRLGPILSIMFLASIGGTGPASADDLVVTSNAASGAGSLAEAITLANGSSGPDTITFDAAVTAIAISASLPSLDAADPVLIDGGGTLSIDGSGAPADTVGWAIASDGHTLRGLAISNFSDSLLLITGASVTVEDCVLTASGGAGIEVAGDDVTVLGCLIGTDGTNDAGNGHAGIFLDQIASAQIGGTTPADRNVISGNSRAGILVDSCGSGVQIQGNYVGLNAAGDTAITNEQGGILVLGTPELLIGGTTPGAGNVISGNTASGIALIDTGSVDFMIQGNFIGTDATGLLPLSIQSAGVYLQETGTGVIGGAAAGARNVISGNTDWGIRTGYVFPVAPIIQNNFFGLGSDGETVIPGIAGIELENGGNLKIGGTGPNEGNYFAGQTWGIQFRQAENCDVLGNYIGVDVNGVAAGNSQGINIGSNCSDIVIGSESGPNVVAHGGNAGILISESSEITMSRNSIFENENFGIFVAPGANGGIAAPVITGLDPVAGTAPAGAVVEIFVDAAGQGRTWIATVTANGGGDFSSAVNLAPHAGLNVTATATDGDGNTSMFSEAAALAGMAGHAADQDGDHEIGLSELLRVAQFFNLKGYGCGKNTEDGYTPNVSDVNCAPHSSDYNPQDWLISLSETLRTIQLYNSGGFFACPDADPPTEDGFCIGTL